jgi:hypothetical protein
MNRCRTGFLDILRQDKGLRSSGGLGLPALRRWLLRLIQALRRLEHRMDLSAVRRTAGMLAPFVTRAGLLAWRWRAERETLSRAAAWASAPPPAFARRPLAIVLRDEGPSGGGALVVVRGLGAGRRLGPRRAAGAASFGFRSRRAAQGRRRTLPA